MRIVVRIIGIIYRRVVNHAVIILIVLLVFHGSDGVFELDVFVDELLVFGLEFQEFLLGIHEEILFGEAFLGGAQEAVVECDAGVEVG